MGDFGGQSATELDSHANMAVAGANVSIISKSGLIATVTPFSPDLPAMDDVEIGDVAMVWDDPRTGTPYILVMRNVLLIPTMDHNLMDYFWMRPPSTMHLCPRYRIIPSWIRILECIYTWISMVYSRTSLLVN